MRLRNVVVLLFLTCAGLLHAQDRGTITGSVLDSSGAVLPTARVTLLNPATGQKQTVDTNAEGSYTFHLGDYQ